MKYFQKLVTGIIFFSLCVAALAAPNIVGKWRGKIDVDWSKVKNATPQQIATTKKQLASLKLVFEFKANKTFTATGGPMGPQGGSWSTDSKGNVEILPAKAKKKQELIVSKNGKSMSASGLGGNFSLTLTKI